MRYSGNERWWGYSHDGFGFNGPYLTAEDALAAAAREVTDCGEREPGDVVELCRCGRRSAGELVTESMASWLLDLLHEEADEIVGDANGGWTLDDLGPRADLHPRLAEAVDSWADAHGQQSTWFVAEDVVEWTLTEEDFMRANPEPVDVRNAVEAFFAPSITLVNHWTEAGGRKHYRAATVYQGDALRALGLPRYPTGDDIDEVLDRLPEGWCLEVIELE